MEPNYLNLTAAADLKVTGAPPASLAPWLSLRPGRPAALPGPGARHGMSRRNLNALAGRFPCATGSESSFESNPTSSSWLSWRVL